MAEENPPPNREPKDGNEPEYPHCGAPHPTRPGTKCGKILTNGQHESPHKQGDITWPGTGP